MANLYMAYDGDNAGRMVGRAVLANDEQALAEVSNRINLGHEIVRHWVEEHGGRIVSGGGDEGTFVVPAEAVEAIEQLRSDYQFSTQLTMTVGIGNTLAEAGKSLMAGKFRGKDQAVMYDASVDADLAAAEQHMADGSASEEEQKIGEAYLAGEEQAAPAAPAAHHADDCQWCQKDPAHEHTDDCQWCAQSEEAAAPTDHTHTDDCQWCAATAEINSHHHSGDDCQWCESAEQRAADQDHDHSDDCQYCAAKSQSSPAANALASGIMTDDPNTQSEKGVINAIDNTQLAIGNDMQDGVSRPEGYSSDAMPQDMGLSEENPDNQGPDYANVLQDGLEEHAGNIAREKIVDMVSQALEGFKANKQILEKAKEQAPDLYNSTIAMLKAMIEMAKQLGLGQEVAQEEAAQDPNAAPEEGAAQAPQL